jgi:unsaturated rhamnogalacturonyl hydrolase
MMIEFLYHHIVVTDKVIELEKRLQKPPRFHYVRPFMLRYVILIVALAFIESASAADSIKIIKSSPWSTRIAESFLLRHPNAVTYDSGFTEQKWNYEQGLMLWSLYQLYLRNGDPRLRDFVIDNLHQYVESDGSIKTYKRSDYNIDLIAPGRALLAAYNETGDNRFQFAADTLRRQLREHPRTTQGGFWHKKIYPNQMWLDGLYMAEPFYAAYAKRKNEKTAFDDIARQFTLLAEHTRDFQTGLYYHAWDESKLMPWANKETGCSPSFWGRAMGWFVMGLVDVLDYFPQSHPKRKELVRIFREATTGILKWRDSRTSLWYLVLDKGDTAGNYLEASSACMFTYAIAKGVRMGYLEKRLFREAQRSFDGIIQYHVTENPDGVINLHHTIKGAGLGGNPYRDGTLAYYAGESQRTNDMKGLGPFLLAAIEVERGMPGRQMIKK